MLKPDTSPDHAQVHSRLRDGDYLRAYDAAQQGLQNHPGDKSLQHATVLSLMRGGALDHAEDLYAAYGLGRSRDEDNLALKGRILKGQLLEAPEMNRTILALESAKAYFAAFEKTGGSYSGINAASLFWLAGDKTKAQSLAQTVLDAMPVPPENDPENLYYHHATRAEIFWILGQQNECDTALILAIRADPENYAARAATLSQFRLLCGDDIDWLKAYQAPKCAHFCGHIFRMNSENQDRTLNDMEMASLSEKIDKLIDDENIGTAYGALAAGSDILIAESLLRKNANLHIVLPAPTDEFCRLSVAPYGDEWLPRFQTCLVKAKSVRILLDEPGDFDDLALQMASRTAMGLTRLQAQHIQADVLQICVVDDSPLGITRVGAQADRKTWMESGQKSLRIGWPGRPAKVANLGLTELSGRAFRAMLFTDLKGYGQTPDLAAPKIVDHIFKPMADICANLTPKPLSLDSWGDGLMLVFNDCESAAHAATALMNKFDHVVEQAGKNHPALSRLALRIGAHFGPVWEREDPFTQRPNLYGRHVTLASRIESMAVPGSIHVSEAFAAILATSATEFVFEYQGERRLSKETLDMPLFSLRRTAQNSG